MIKLKHLLLEIKMSAEDALNFLKTLNVDVSKLNKNNLKSTYRELSKKLHPDMGGDEEKSKMLNAAYEILKTNLPDIINTPKKIPKIDAAFFDLIKGIQSVLNQFNKKINPNNPNINSELFIRIGTEHGWTAKGGPYSFNMTLPALEILIGQYFNDPDSRRTDFYSKIVIEYEDGWIELLSEKIFLAHPRAYDRYEHWAGNIKKKFIGGGEDSSNRSDVSELTHFLEYLRGLLKQIAEDEVWGYNGKEYCTNDIPVEDFLSRFLDK